MCRPWDASPNYDLKAVEIADNRQLEWDSFVAAHPQGHLLQGFAWGKLKENFGWQPVRLALLEADRIQATAQVLFRRLPLVTLAYVPRGPVVDWNNKVAVKMLLQAIERAGRARRAVFLKIEPNLPHAPALHERLRGLGFRSSRTVQPRSTLVLNLELDEDELLGQMKSKTRYNVRLAGRRGVTIRSAQHIDEVSVFYDMLLETAQRDAFGIHTLAYYQAVYHLFNASGQGNLLFAEREGQLLAALWAIAFGQETIYMYGASRREGQRHMPTYLLQWEAMRWARSRGCSRYDLWGIPDSVATEQDERVRKKEKNVRDGLWGVYRFKQGFGGEIVRTPGAYDLPYWRAAYWFYRGLLAG
jgi:lipid II:glycine glycyltransferase (peptidoglycan interpeptide bridge formation enzyme)